jgi:hypothetical protein
MAVFGLVLALLQPFPTVDSRSYELGPAIGCPVFAIVSGSLVDAMRVKNARVAHATLFGLLFGAFSFGYIFGDSWAVTPSTQLAGLVAGLGGKIAESVPVKPVAAATS